MAPDRITIVAYSDYVCPWCYIALERIERLQRELPVDVVWRPFELHPETPRGGAHLAGRLGSSARAAAYANNITSLAEESGIALKMPEIVANSHLALEAAEFAREHGGFERYHRALFSSYFEHGRDLGDPDVLSAVARSSGVDDQGLRQALADGRYAAIIDSVTDAARAHEIMSMPTFVFDGGFRLTGAQDYAVFKSITSRLLAKQVQAETS
jgi:predicted DsbA family dithiol-disulfide isomerase